MLRQLKDWAGLTYRQIDSLSNQHGVRVARSTIAAALERDTLPRDSVVHTLVRACGQDPRPWTTARKRLACVPESTVTRPADAPPSYPAPRQLPLDTTDFVGREGELACLGRLLAGEHRTGGIVVVSGSAGAGKSALAVRAARRSLPEFPDGQLYVDLQGAAPRCEPLTPYEAAKRMLRGLGVGEAEIPPTGAEAAALLRTVAAGRRLLVLLDNAASVRQVRPLAHIGRRTVVLVTSRVRLTSLTGSRSITLAALPPHDATAFLYRAIDRERAHGHPRAVARLAELCGYLPLALHVAAARLAARPHWSVETLVRRLSDERGRLDQLRIDDLDVRASLAVSREALDASGDRTAARLFELLGSLPRGDVGLGNLVRLVAAPPVAVECAMDLLVDLHLVDEVGCGRYRFPEMVWLLARERTSVPLRAAG